MGHRAIRILVPLLFASCTALSQKDSYLDSLPRTVPPTPPSNILFTEDFESGLSQWSQLSGSWTTGSPGPNGVALISPTSSSAATLSIATAASIDLTGKSGCLLEYDTRYLLKGVSGVSANVLFGSNIVGTFKETSGLSDISSATNFVHRKAILPTNGNGRISFVSSVIDNTTGYADWRIDNVTVKCNGTTPSAVTLIDENFESSAANWTLQAPWVWSSGVGMSGSMGLQAPVQAGTFTGVMYATYIPSINLTNRFSCLIEYYYSIVNSSAPNCISLDLNGIRTWVSCDTPSNSGVIKTYLTAFEDNATNTLQLRCLDGNAANGWGIQCVVDQVKLTCQQ